MALTKTPSELTAADLTITTAAQPNITSVGTLTGLTVTKASSGATPTVGTVVTIEDDDNAELSILGGSSSLLAINFGHSGDPDDAIISYNTTSGSEAMAFTVNAAERMRIDASGDVSVAANATGAARVKGVSGDQVDRNAGGYPQYTFVGNEGTGMRRASANTLAFDSGGAERMRIDSAGNVTLRPDGGATTGTLRIHNGNGNGTLGQIQFGYSSNVDHGSITYNGNMDFFAGDSSDSRFFIGGTGNIGINTASPEHHLHVTEPGSVQEDGIVKIGGSSTALGLELKYSQTGHTVTEIVANPTYTNTASLMRLCVDRDANANQLCLLGSGNIGIGTDSPGSSKLYVTSDTDAIFTAYFVNDHSGGYGVAIRSDSSSMMYFYDGGTFKGRIYHNGTTMLYADQSDYRLKENVQTMTGSIDRIKKLNPVTFDWKADGKSSEGFLAHEVQDVVPTAVAGEKDAEITEHGEGIQIMDYGKVTPVLVGALQEALAKIEALEEEVKALKET